MFARNLLQAGDFVTLVPIGVPIILQYNDKVEVLEPTSLRDMMIEHAWNMLKLYNEL